VINTFNKRKINQVVNVFFCLWPIFEALLQIGFKNSKKQSEDKMDRKKAEQKGRALGQTNK